MSNVRESCVPRKFRSMKSALVVLAAAAVLVSACGSGDKSSSGSSESSETTAAVAGAQENAVGDAVCFDWPSGTAAKACAVGLKGPGGGRVFYDAGSVQSWGRFLEVAPQAWGGTLYDCSSCGAATGVEQKTSDRRGEMPKAGYFLCRDTRDSLQEEGVAALLLPGEAGDTLWEIGGGRHNTEVLSKTAECVDGSVSALTLTTGYRGGGLSDWYLPSGGELTELCKYTGRNAIGGFPEDSYVSSTVGPTGAYTNFFGLNFADAPTCTRTDILQKRTYNGGRTQIVEYIYYDYAVRPIRAFA